MNHVLLVAAREVHEAFRSRAYWLTMGAVLVGVAAIVVLPRLLGTDPEWTLGVGGEPPAGIEQDVSALARAFDAEIELVTLGDRAQAERAVADEEIDAAVVFAGEGSALVRRAATPEGLVGLAGQLAGAVAVRERLLEAGVGAGEVQDALAAPAPLEVVVDDEQPGRSAVAAAVSLALFFALVMGGGTVAQGVALEKSTRVAEVLVTTLRPSQHLAGKVLGIGGYTLLVLLAGAVPFTVGVLTGYVDVPTAEVGDVVGGLGWFLLGFAVYAMAFAVLGALIDRQDDVSGAGTPLMLALFLAYFASIHAQSSPDSLVAQATSIFPLSAPLVMPVRTAEGATSSWEIAAAVALCLLTVVLLVRVGGAAYRRALLRGGQRLKLMEVLRG